MRILYTSPVLEHPPAGGGQLRVENSIKALSGICELDIISRSPSAVAGGEAARRFYLRYCSEFHFSPATVALSGNRYVRKIQRIVNCLFSNGLAKDAEYILRHIDRRNIELVWFGYGNISFPLIRAIKRARPKLKVVCDTDSVWSRFILRELPYAKGLRRLYLRWSGARKEREERAWVNLCEVTTAVSEIDAQYYRSLAADPSRVHIFSNVIDMASYAAPPPKAEGLKNPSIYLAGTFGRYHSPMDVAARWMLEEVWPRVQSQMPQAHFYLVGKDSDLMYGHLQDPSITVTGKLPSVLPYLCHVDVALVPLKFESGTRFKILEAGACRVPLVSTTLGAEGIPVAHGEHLMIADSPQDFADAILELLRDKEKAKQLAERCYALVAESYSVEYLRKEAQAILVALGFEEAQAAPFRKTGTQA